MGESSWYDFHYVGSKSDALDNMLKEMPPPEKIVCLGLGSLCEGEGHARRVSEVQLALLLAISERFEVYYSTFHADYRLLLSPGIRFLRPWILNFYVRSICSFTYCFATLHTDFRRNQTRAIVLIQGRYIISHIVTYLQMKKS